ncbi:MAG: hypothetical protein ACK55I_29130, partial [bacterium]
KNNASRGPVSTICQRMYVAPQEGFLCGFITAGISMLGSFSWRSESTSPSTPRTTRLARPIAWAPVTSPPSWP